MVPLPPLIFLSCVVLRYHILFAIRIPDRKKGFSGKFCKLGTCVSLTRRYTMVNKDSICSYKTIEACLLISKAGFCFCVFCVVCGPAASRPTDNEGSDALS